MKIGAGYGFLAFRKERGNGPERFALTNIADAQVWFGHDGRDLAGRASVDRDVLEVGDLCDVVPLGKQGWPDWWAPVASVKITATKDGVAEFVGGRASFLAFRGLNGDKPCDTPGNEIQEECPDCGFGFDHHPEPHYDSE